MKLIIVLVAALAVAYPAHGLFLDTIVNAANSISNTVSSLASTVESTVNSISSAIDTAQFIGTFLWDNAFGPSLDLFLDLGADFIDNYFGSILNGIGKKREAELRFQWNTVQTIFHTEATAIISHYQSLFLQFVQDAQSTVLVSIVGLVFGTTTINDVMGVLLTKVKALVAEALQYGIAVLDTALTPLGSQFAGLGTGLQTILTNLANQFQAEINAVTAGIINAFNGALAVFHTEFDDLYQYFTSQFNLFMADFNKILASSLLGLLFGITNVNAIFDKIIDTAKTYVMVTLQYTYSYVVLNANNFLVAFQPFLAEAAGVVVQQLTSMGVLSPIVNIGPVISNFLTTIITPQF